MSITHSVVDTPEEAERTGFRGSPSILINGVDPFADSDDPVGLSCRVYQTPEGPGHRPWTSSVMSSSEDERRSALGVAALATMGLGVCCGLQLLLAAGATVSVAGIGIRSWVLVVAGVSVAAFAVPWNRRGHRASQHHARESIDAY
jgi:hypothetical protein